MQFVPSVPPVLQDQFVGAWHLSPQALLMLVFSCWIHGTVSLALRFLRDSCLGLRS